MPKDLISARDLKKADVKTILSHSERMLKLLDSGKQAVVMKNKIAAMLFFEPSTRTRLSFETAVKKLSGDVIGFSSAEGSSVSKGESLADTVRVVERYADLIVIRHKMEGSARLAADYAKVSVINAGDGSNQHPTQALLDMLTIKNELGLNGLRVALCGDLKYGRTVHSLIYLLAMFNASIYLVSPPELGMPEHIINEVMERYGIEIRKERSIENVLSEVDVAYITRIQRERFPDPNEYEKVKSTYFVSAEMIKRTKSKALILHPLPRVDEIKYDVDSLSNAKYFDQVRYGVAARMGIIKWVME